MNPISSLRPTDAAPSQAPLDPQLKRAASEFEGIFLRALLKPMEKTTGGHSSTHYGSMVVSALSDAVSSAGGLGLGPVISGALSQKLGTWPSEPRPIPPPLAPRPPPADGIKPLR
jgi:Rod binding domain-containing protein